MEFEPGVEDHGKSITCRAENPNVTGLFLEKSWKIDVVCKYTILKEKEKIKKKKRWWRYKTKSKR